MMVFVKIGEKYLLHLNFDFFKKFNQKNIFHTFKEKKHFSRENKINLQKTIKIEWIFYFPLKNDEKSVSIF